MLGRPTSIIIPVYVLIGLECIAIALLMPILPIITTEYFARQFNGGLSIDCTIHEHDQPCIRGSSVANYYSSISSSIGSFVMIFVSVFVGQASDRFGRKAFIVLSQVLNLAYPASILVFDQFHGSIAMYYAVTFITTAYSTFSIAIASVADVVSPKNRATGFAILMAVASCGFVISAAVSATMTTVQILRVVSGLYVLRCLWAVFILEETLPVAKRVPTLDLKNPLSAMKILFRTSLFRRLSLIIFLNNFVSSGAGGIIFFYLNSHFDFDKDGIATFIVVDGLSSLIVQGFLVKPLIDLFHERGVISLTIFFSILKYSILTIASVYPHKWIIYTYAAMSGLSSLGFPAIASLKSIHCSESEQGQIQGAISSVKAIAGVFGPLVYTWLYTMAQEAPSELGNSIPFILSGLICVVSFTLSMFIPRTAVPVEKPSTLEPLLDEDTDTSE